MRIWEDGYVINQIVIRAPREITNAMIAAHLGDERNDQRAQTKANTAKMMRSHPRCSRTRQTPSGGLGVATAILNMICQCTIPERTSISNVAAEKSRLAQTQDQDRHAVAKLQEGLPAPVGSSVFVVIITCPNFLIVGILSTFRWSNGILSG